MRPPHRHDGYQLSPAIRRILLRRMTLPSAARPRSAYGTRQSPCYPAMSHSLPAVSASLRDVMRGGTKIGRPQEARGIQEADREAQAEACSREGCESGHRHTESVPCHAVVVREKRQTYGQ